jgi:hypothetical protein
MLRARGHPLIPILRTAAGHTHPSAGVFLKNVCAGGRASDEAGAFCSLVAINELDAQAFRLSIHHQGIMCG